MKDVPLGLLVVFALAMLGGALSCWLEPAHAQQTVTLPGYIEFRPDTLRPLVNDPEPLKKLVLTIQSGPPQAGVTAVVATTDGNAHLAARDHRARWAVFNPTAETVYFAFAAGVSSDNGVPVAPGGSTSMAYTGPVYVYSASGAARVIFSEGWYP